MVVALADGTANADPKGRDGTALRRRETARCRWADSGMCLRVCRGGRWGEDQCKGLGDEEQGPELKG